MQRLLSILPHSKWGSFCFPQAVRIPGKSAWEPGCLPYTAKGAALLALKQEEGENQMVCAIFIELWVLFSSSNVFPRFPPASGNA